MHALINGIKMAYDDFGNGPAVVLIHDLPLCRKMWQHQVEPLANAGYRVIAPDLRGFGDSETGVKNLSLQQNSDDIVGLLRYLGLGRSVLIGLGAGNHVIDDIQQRYPGRVAAAIFLSPYTTTVRRNNSAHQELLKLHNEGDRQQLVETLCQQLLPQQQPLTTQQFAWEIQQWIEEATPNALTAALKLPSREQYHICSRIPILIMEGSRTRRLEEQEPVMNIQTAVEISGAGHLFNLEKPELVNTELIAFLTWLCSAKTRHHRLALAA